MNKFATVGVSGLTEEARLAIEFWIERAKTDPKVMERADAVRQKIEREAPTRRGAIDSIFDAKPKAGEQPTRGRADRWSSHSPASSRSRDRGSRANFIAET
ncbi:hypothetical protein, partial [Pseudolysinimonas sp.]|uniref:hypothetical protein n=1 Tax=Pseudolysinimonas sp. TaxID=2680009 RepID=UPI0037842E56